MADAQFTYCCRGCGLNLPREAFAKNASRTRVSRCKPCMSKYGQAQWAGMTPDERRAAMKAKRDREGERWSERYRKDAKLYRTRHPRRRRAHKLLNHAVAAGKIQRQPCDVCGAAKAEGHHDDYAQPYIVRWLCLTHHREHHRLHGAAKNAD